jgi:uncharacterized protein
MKTTTIKKLCCPFDYSDLELTTISSNLEGDVIEGFLHCTTCKRLYPIIKGIPLMSPDEFREFSLEQPLFDKWEKYLEGKSFTNFRLEDNSLSIENHQDKFLP